RGKGAGGGAGWRKPVLVVGREGLGRRQKGAERDRQQTERQARRYWRHGSARSGPRLHCLEPAPKQDGMGSQPAADLFADFLPVHVDAQVPILRELKRWNMARQRYCRKLARFRRVLRISADRAGPGWVAAAKCSGTEGLQTGRWRE